MPADTVDWCLAYSIIRIKCQYLCAVKIAVTIERQNLTIDSIYCLIPVIFDKRINKLPNPDFPPIRKHNLGGRVV
uniref:Uncharacterized protein n=1 Tax=Candidatus Methanogaster sp. ANME-2c ERB4 TaxID=2759911 RepID=A0A7G9YRE2_9EURY|nr:hypothetical protein BMFBKKFN_00002 [Methanosarcinales archaeon ANME-2c ERB4]